MPKNYILVVEQDPDPQSPSDCGNTDRFLVVDIRRSLEVDPPKGLSKDPEVLREQGYHIFQLWAYVHGGVSLSLSRSGQFADAWDSGCAGFVAVDAAQAFGDAAWREQHYAGKTDEQIARVLAEGLVEEWNDFLSGNVHGYRVFEVSTCNQGHEHRVEVDSCWGFVGDEKDAREQGELALKGFQEREGDAPSPVHTMLDLSTVHMPESEPDFSGLRAAQHEYGYVVFVDGEAPAEDVPAWLVPVWNLAVDTDCMLINFDRDGRKYPQFQSWEW